MLTFVAMLLPETMTAREAALRGAQVWQDRIEIGGKKYVWDKGRETFVRYE